MWCYVVAGGAAAWYVSNVSIIYEAFMLLYYLFWMIMGFIIHFYIIFGTNLLTGGPTHIAVFCLFQCLIEKEYQTESKRNETFGSVIFGANVIQETWSWSQGSFKVATRVGVPPLLGAPSCLVAASAAAWLALQVLWIMFVPKITLPKVSFHLDSIWYSFSSKHLNRQENSNMGWASG